MLKLIGTTTLLRAGKSADAIARCLPSIKSFTGTFSTAALPVLWMCTYRVAVFPTCSMGDDRLAESIYILPTFVDGIGISVVAAMLESEGMEPKSVALRWKSEIM